MRSAILVSIIVLSISVASAIAQTNPPPAPPATPPSTSTAVPVPRAATSALVGKRLTCRQDMSAKGLRGQELRDQTQLCIAQGQIDCLKQAIDQKVVGPQRRDFIKNCLGAASVQPDE